MTHKNKRPTAFVHSPDTVFLVDLPNDIEWITWRWYALLLPQLHSCLREFKRVLGWQSVTRSLSPLGPLRHTDMNPSTPPATPPAASETIAGVFASYARSASLKMTMIDNTHIGA